jgi:hypothetical protein
MDRTCKSQGILQINPEMLAGKIIVEEATWETGHVEG